MVIIVGDSLNRNQWEPLAYLLLELILMEAVSIRSSKQRVPRLLDRLSPFAQKWRGDDVMVFNSGHDLVGLQGGVQAITFWWDLFQYKGKLAEEMIESAFNKGIRTGPCWINRHLDATKTTIVFCGISPQHQCYNKAQPVMVESYVAFPDPAKEIIEKTIGSMMIPVRYLNNTKLSRV
ncbi:hypothetical protein POTOM_060265 [Populus tomentosa]|uniref:Trichome birefringence-like C-terminal domain-containing protein n=1 Tax=Populus tomentosa TaxID=118781 RepID=A0A8X7XQU3_POPTO|nr:hypothetical protein POTOM_060265 [Populus tomentosa]